MSTPKQGDAFSVVYSIADVNEWAKTNPLRYSHNGLVAYAVSRGDLYARHEALLNALQQIYDNPSDEAQDIAKAAIDNDSKR